MRDIIISVGSALGSPLALIRSIKKKVNCRAYILCTHQKSREILAKSKYVDQAILIDGSSENTFITGVKDWYSGQKFNLKPIFYFTYDSACVYVDSHRKWFENKFILCMPSSRIIQSFTEKGVAEKVARDNGLTVPKTRLIESTEDITFVLEKFKLPLIVKPTASNRNSQLGFKVKKVGDRNEFKNIADQIKSDDKTFVAQEYIPGNDEAAWYYIFYRSQKGLLWENMGRKILQAPPGGGIMAKGKVEYNSELSQYCRRFLEEINYCGIGGIEFKKYNDEYYFIEMSVRLEGFHQIEDASDSFISLASYYDLNDQDDELSQLIEKKQTDGVIYMAFIPTMITRIKTRNIPGFIKDFTAAIFSKRISLNVYSREDSKPFWTTLKRMIIR